MPEPTTGGSVGLVAIAIALLGPAAGPYAVIVLSALAGALWALSRSETATRVHGALLLARLVVTAIVLTGAVAWWLESQYKLPAHQLLAPVAFGIGAMGDGWRSVIDGLVARLGRGSATGGGQ